MFLRILIAALLAVSQPAFSHDDEEAKKISKRLDALEKSVSAGPVLRYYKEPKSDTARKRPKIEPKVGGFETATMVFFNVHGKAKNTQDSGQSVNVPNHVHQKNKGSAGIYVILEVGDGGGMKEVMRDGSHWRFDAAPANFAVSGSHGHYLAIGEEIKVRASVEPRGEHGEKYNRKSEVTLEIFAIQAIGEEIKEN